MRRKSFRRLTATLLALLMVVKVMTIGFPVTVNAEQTAVTYAVYSWDDETNVYPAPRTAAARGLNRTTAARRTALPPLL